MNTAENTNARTEYAVSLARRRAALNAISRDLLTATDHQVALIQKFARVVTHPEENRFRRGTGGAHGS